MSSNASSSGAREGGRGEGVKPTGVGSQPCVGAEGYGLNERQQKAAADLWAWQRESMQADVVLGGPITG